MIGEPHFDADNNFIHHCCKCGGEAPFGFGVSLRRGRLGIWYCANHRPLHQTASMTNGLNSPSSPSSTPDPERPVDGEAVLTANGKPDPLAAPSFNKTNQETNQ
jgi:hypothetical protein